jgi:hypothetical protein
MLCAQKKIRLLGVNGCAGVLKKPRKIKVPKPFQPVSRIKK